MVIWPTQKMLCFRIMWKFTIFYLKFYFWQFFCYFLTVIFVPANGGPQGSVLSPTSFLRMIKDILPAPPRNLEYSLCYDWALWHSSGNAELPGNCIQLALDMIHNRGFHWDFKFSTRKSIDFFFSYKRKQNVKQTLDSHPKSTSVQFLGLRPGELIEFC